MVPFFRVIGAKVRVAKRPLPGGVKPPFKVAKQPLLCCGVTLRCHHRSPLDLGPPLVYANMVANRGLHYFMSKAVFQDSFGKEEVAK